MRDIDADEILNALADLTEALPIRQLVRRRRTVGDRWALLGVALAGFAAGTAAFWLLRDESRRREVHRTLNDARDSAAGELREAIQRGRTAAEHAATQAPVGAEEARELLKQATDALEEAAKSLRAGIQKPSQGTERETFVGSKGETRRGATSRRSAGDLKTQAREPKATDSA